ARAVGGEGPACRQAGMPRSERLRPLRPGQVRGLLRGVRQLLIEEPTLRARPQRARLPTLHALTTSAAFRGKMRSSRRILPPSGGSYAAKSVVSTTPTEQGDGPIRSAF